jgi:hypothetical protein
MGRVLVLAALAALFAGALWLMIEGLRIGGDVALPASAQIAMWGGIVLTLLVGGGLMALLFYSNRHGYDEPPMRLPDSPREDAEGDEPR